MLTNQLAVSQVADWITRGLVNSPTETLKNMELLYFICTLNLTLTINQSIKTHFYSAICRVRIRGT